MDPLSVQRNQVTTLGRVAPRRVSRILGMIAKKVIRLAMIPRIPRQSIFQKPRSKGSGTRRAMACPRVLSAIDCSQETGKARRDVECWCSRAAEDAMKKQHWSFAIVVLACLAGVPRLAQAE